MTQRQNASIPLICIPLLVVMDRSKYTEKYLEILSSKNVQLLRMTLQNYRNQKYVILEKELKSEVVDQENKHLYPTGSQPGKFYCTVKLHKFPINGNLNDLPLWPVVSKITTSACNLKALLSKLLLPLLQPHHNIKTNQDFI